MSYPVAPVAAPAVIPADTVELFRQTALWTRIVSIFFLLGLFFMLVASIGSFVMIGFVHSRDVPPFFAIGASYFVMLLLYITPAILLWSYASRSRRVSREPSAGALAAAVAVQKSFWKYLAILFIIITALNVITIPIVSIVIVLNK